MLVGLISDTHGLLRPQVLEAFRGVDAIVHAGDIGRLEILDELGSIAPVTAVWGNTDGFSIRSEVAETGRLETPGGELVVVHGHQWGSPTPPELRAAHPGARVIVYGHTHFSLVRQEAGCLVVNPGAAGPARFGAAPSVALLDAVPDAVTVRIIRFERR